MNNFELMGKLNWSEIKFTESGKTYTKALIAEKKKDTDTWVTFPVTAFNTAYSNCAEKLSEIPKSNYVKVKGKLENNTWTDKVTGKEISRVELIVFDVVEMVFDVTSKKFVEKVKENCVENEKFATTEKTVENEVIDEEIPF